MSAPSRSLLAAALIACAPAFAEGWGDADVVFLGEVHDNPAHHARQAALVAEIAPAALVFEMLTPDLAARVSAELIGDADALGAALEWEERGWPDFSMYYPIFAAAPEAAVFGANVPREDARAVMGESAAAVFGVEADRFGLASPLDADQQAAREALQQAVHCDAMPVEILPAMVEIQRLRDAVLARAAALAMTQTGGPVVVITGNGHARTDWGAPAALSAAAPDLVIRSLGQGETDIPPQGTFDTVAFSPPVDRPDPCAAFRTN
jgi:uncharacterized iron-regulated protein